MKKKTAIDTFFHIGKLPAKPICISFNNKTNETKEAKLFGYNKYFLSENFGNDKDIELYVSGHQSYAECISESATLPFMMQRFRLISTNKKQLNMILNYTRRIRSHEINEPIDCGKFKSTKAMNDIVKDFDYKEDINATVYFSFQMLPKTYLKIIIYPL